MTTKRYHLYWEDKKFSFETEDEMKEKEREIIDLVNKQHRRSAYIDYDQKEKGMV